MVGRVGRGPLALILLCQDPTWAADVLPEKVEKGEHARLR
jgi:hypothetical protein